MPEIHSTCGTSAGAFVRLARGDKSEFKIKHEIRGRIRIHMEQKRMTHEQADILLFYLQNIDGVFRADVYDRTADATIHYKGNRETIIEGLRRFRYEE